MSVVFLHETMLYDKVCRRIKYYVVHINEPLSSICSRLYIIYIAFGRRNISQFNALHQRTSPMSESFGFLNIQLWWNKSKFYALQKARWRHITVVKCCVTISIVVNKNVSRVLHVSGQQIMQLQSHKPFHGCLLFRIGWSLRSCLILSHIAWRDIFTFNMQNTYCE